jgi:hypothetical protein
MPTPRRQARRSELTLKQLKGATETASLCNRFFYDSKRYLEAHVLRPIDLLLAGKPIGGQPHIGPDTTRLSPEQVIDMHIAGIATAVNRFRARPLPFFDPKAPDSLDPGIKRFIEISTATLRKPIFRLLTHREPSTAHEAILMAAAHFACQYTAAMDVRSSPELQSFRKFASSMRDCLKSIELPQTGATMQRLLQLEHDACRDRLAHPAKAQKPSGSTAPRATKGKSSTPGRPRTKLSRTDDRIISLWEGGCPVKDIPGKVDEPLKYVRRVVDGERKRRNRAGLSPKRSR